MSSLFKKPATLMYPVIPRKWQERTRGHIEVDMEACILCGICSKKCPTNAIEVSRDEKTWSIERMQCIQCSCCVEVCPKKCLFNKNEYTTPDVNKITDTFKKPDEPAKADGEATEAAETASYPADGKLQVNDTCIYCGICAKKCPADAITVERAKKDKDTGEMVGENKWDVDHDACVKCGICVEACPKKSLTIE